MGATHLQRRTMPASALLAPGTIADSVTIDTDAEAYPVTLFIYTSAGGTVPAFGEIFVEREGPDGQYVDTGLRLAANRAEIELRDKSGVYRVRRPTLAVAVGVASITVAL